MSPAEILAAILIANDVGVAPPAPSTPWNIYYARMPDGGDEALCVYDSGASVDNRSLRSGTTYQRYMVQIRIRARTYSAAWTKALELGAILDAVKQAEINRGSALYVVDTVHRKDVIPLGQEAGGKRELVVINASMVIDYTEAGDDYLSPSDENFLRTLAGLDPLPE